ncbi:MAG: NADH-quinone oxidoreductase subunit N, partial [Chitinophagaceae bacterium]|nr:NADH-quinone oxidoreductase subunit N [Chitinophagaceae bacterium]
MNALILSAVWGVVMMFSSFLLKQKAGVRNLAIIGLVGVLVANILEMGGT